MILVDSNVILDVITQNENWYQWSSDQLAKYCESDQLLINNIIYSEISIAFQKIEELEETLANHFILANLTKEALFLAGKAFKKYKNLGGTKNSTLPDFFIGAHAAILNISLLTRDIKRYSNYFPTVKLITP